MRLKLSKMKQHQFICFLLIFNCITQSLLAQSIGYQPNFNAFGFNPYMSPVYGYGLGLGMGSPYSYSSYGLNSFKNPWASGSSSSWSPQTNFASKFHAKSILKKLGSAGYDPYLTSAAYNSPYSYNYGYGKHYGAAQIPNNPYKSTYGDYYSTTSGDQLGTSTKTSVSAYSGPYTNPYDSTSPLDSIEPQYNDYMHMNKHAIIKPLIKAGAILTTAAILGKKKFELVPHKLNPTGMILNSLS